MTLTPDTHNTPEAMDAFWASVDDGYFEDREWMYRRVAQFLAGTYFNPESSKLYFCDYGCGCGHFIAILKEIFPRSRFIGVDFSEIATQKAYQLNGNAINFLKSSISELPGFPPNVFDAAVCLQTLEHVYDYTNALKRIMQTVCFGGQLILTVPNNDGWGGHYNHWTPETFRELLETYGEVAECMTFGRNEGDDTNILARVVKV